MSQETRLSTKRSRPPEVRTPGKQQLAVELGVGAGPTARGHPDNSTDGGGAGTRQRRGGGEGRGRSGQGRRVGMRPPKRGCSGARRFG